MMSGEPKSEILSNTLKVGDKFDWFDNSLEDVQQNFSREHDFLNLGKIRHCSWSTRDGFTIFESTIKLTDARTSKYYVLLDHEKNVKEIIEIEDVENCQDIAWNLVEKAKKK